jgi:hypothetical protein
MASMVMNSTFRPVQRSVLATLLGAVACYAVVAINDPPGPGIDPDSISYLGAAASVVQRGALRVPFAEWSSPDSTSPLSHFPPGYPLALAVPLALGAPPVQAARGVEAVAAFATVALGVWLVAGAAGGGAGVLAGVVLLASPSLAFDHWQILSEPLCLALLVLTVALMARGARPWTYGATAAAAGLVRYAGVSAVGAAVLWAFGRAGGMRQRLRRAAAAAVPGIVLEGAWFLRGAIEGGEERRLAWQGGLAATIRELGSTLGTWLAPLVRPAELETAVALLVTGAVVAAVAGVARDSGRDAGPRAGAAASAERLLAACGVLAACYAGLVIWSRLFVYDNIPFDQRLLSPLILLAELAAVTAFGARWRRWRVRWRVAAAAGAALWVGASAWATMQAVRDARDGGWGYAGDEWRASALAQWLRTGARGDAIFSDNPATVFAVTGRPSRNVPGTLDADSVAAFARVFAARPAVLVRFPFSLEAGAPPDSLAARLGLREIARFADGAVWGPAAAPPEPGR